jgi:hypothetical protein
MAAPVRLCAAGSHSHSTTRAISSGVDVRPVGCFSRSRSRMAGLPVAAELCRPCLDLGFDDRRLGPPGANAVGRDATAAAVAGLRGFQRGHASQADQAELRGHVGAFCTDATSPCTEAMLTMRP